MNTNIAFRTKNEPGGDREQRSELKEAAASRRRRESGFEFYAQRNNPMKKRRAFTLIEMVFLVIAEMAVAALGVGVLLLATEIQTKEHRGDPARLAASKLAGQFRKDVRDADEAKLESDVLLRLFHVDGLRIEYAVTLREFPERSVLYRYRYENDRRSGVEVYTLPDHSNAWFVSGEDRYAGLLALNIWTEPVDRRGTVFRAMPEKESLNPFTRKISAGEGAVVDPRYAANWRTIITGISDRKQ